jgi:acetoin utilization deacetylase AcuC-like enzyme
MKVVFNHRHAVHAPREEFSRGALVAAFETADRADRIVSALHGTPHAPFLPPTDHGMAPIERIHAARYLRFIRQAHAQWLAEGGQGDALPGVWPVRTLRSDVEPTDVDARLGLYSMDTATPVTAGTWEAAYWSAQATLTGWSLLRAGERAAYVLTRPPGHHAGHDFFGGYCYINNAAVVAQAARDAGLARVAILDVDYHHGNGTQAIFYERADVFYASLHGDPRTEYPYFLGHADERGEGAGLGFNANWPLPAGTGGAAWFAALAEARGALAAFRPELLIVSLGLDTFEDDPISHFKLTRADFTRLGAELSALGWPTLLLQEGGYANEALGLNVRAVLDGFDQAAAAAR